MSPTATVGLQRIPRSNLYRLEWRRQHHGQLTPLCWLEVVGSSDRHCLDEELLVPDSSSPDSTVSSAESAHPSLLLTASSLSLALPCRGGTIRALTRRSGAMASWVWLFFPVSRMNGGEQ
ncbi:unnamed protein product [Phytophthora fragariaefolia]|uniref:Unnamed protein product n=1 Tax=Phytophthora fragariaefolia TaxID=1490495 RepID=A0A9W6UDK7_9STRA|nr:unnamed protein product [Phytophthora fragariaefolia]